MRSSVAVCMAAMLLAGAGLAFAQQPAVAPGQPAAAAGGPKVASGQAPVVGGNVASARVRALDEAVRQAVAQAVEELVDPRTRAASPKPLKTITARARTYVRGYRILEEGEANGGYLVSIEADVDQVLLRRAVESALPSAPVPAAPAKETTTSVLVVPSGVPEAGAALVSAINAAGGRARVGSSTRTDASAAVQEAARAGASAAVLVSATAEAEGIIRGPAKVAVSCRLSAQLLAVPSGEQISAPSAAPRAFAEREDAARGDCLSRAAAEIAPRLLPGGFGAARAPSDVGTLLVDADVVEPSAVPALLKGLRALGAVSSAELRRVTAGRAEIAVRTRLGAPALAAALARDTTGPLSITNAETLGDRVRLRARLRTPGPSSAQNTTP